MAKTFFDSSVLLTVLLAEPRAEEASRLWLGNQDKVASILLEAECLNGLRRAAARAGKSAPMGWLENQVAFLGASLNDVTSKHVDSDVMSRVRSETALSNCRTLDAIHLATAMYFASKGEEEVLVVSFDTRMRETAAMVGLKVLPA